MESFIRLSLLRLLSAFLLVLCLTLPACADEVDDFIQAALKRRKIPGLALAVVREGKVVKLQGYGFADGEQKVRVSPDTEFSLGAVANTFTAALTLLLAEEGKLSLDEPIGRYVANAPESWNGITVRHLLLQTSGLKEVSGANPPKLAELPLDFPPGTAWAESRSNALLLEKIIARVSGGSYGEALRERILAPLKITTAEVSGDGDLRMSARNLARWSAALEADKPLSPGLRKTWWTPGRRSDGRATGCGMGWMLRRENGRQIVEQSGAGPGYAAHIARYPDDRLTVVVLTHQAGSEPGAIAREVAGLYVTALRPTPLEVAQEPAVLRLVEEVLTELAENRVRVERFTPDLQQMIKPEQGESLSVFIRTLGPLRSVTITARKLVGEERNYGVRISFATEEVRLMLTLDRQDRIAGLMLLP